MFRKKIKQDQPSPFTLLEGNLSTFEDPQVFRVGGGAVHYNMGLASDRDDVKLKILVPVLVQAERNGEPLGIVNLGTLKLADLQKIFQDKIRKAWGMTRQCPQIVLVPLQTVTVKGEKFSVVLEAEKEVKRG